MVLTLTSRCSESAWASMSDTAASERSAPSNTPPVLDTRRADGATPWSTAGSPAGMTGRHRAGCDHDVGKSGKAPGFDERMDVESQRLGSDEEVDFVAFHDAEVVGEITADHGGTFWHVADSRVPGRDRIAAEVGCVREVHLDQIGVRLDLPVAGICCNRGDRHLGRANRQDTVDLHRRSQRGSPPPDPRPVPDRPEERSRRRGRGGWRRCHGSTGRSWTRR